MTIDDFLARGIYGAGNDERIYRRIAEFTVDGERLGAIPFDSVSGSRNDPRLSDRRAEIQSAAYTLARLGYQRVPLISRSAEGAKLESPDLDAFLPEHTGLEVAEGIGQIIKAREMEISNLEVALLDRRDADPSFSAALGAVSLWVDLASDLTAPRITKSERKSIDAELQRFIRSRAHFQIADDDDPDFAAFPPAYPLLHKRGAHFGCRPSAFPHIGIRGGAEAVDTSDTAGTAIAILNKHRNAARKYRPVPTWMIMFLSEWVEFARDTVPAIAQLNPPIDPFVRCYVSDIVGRTVLLQSQQSPLDLTAELPPRKELP